MLCSIEDIYRISKEFDVPVADVLFIALNRYGIEMENYDDNRIRFKLKTDLVDELYYFAVCVNTFKSPFKIIDNNLLLGEEKVAEIIDLEKDTCDSTYFRKNKTEMTLNSNMRSQCKGCTFCGTYNLRPEDLCDLTNTDSLKRYIEQVLEENKMDNLAQIEGITVCTGCFKTERDVVNHLKLLKSTLKEYQFNKKLKYIGSQIRSDWALQEISDEIGDFSLFITTEKFTGREKIMRPEKANLNLEKTIELLDKSINYGFDSTFLYILGLEDLNTFKEYLNYLAPHVNKFPLVQIFQDYNKNQENYRIDEAKNIDYYLIARKILEDTFDNKDFKPESWENYRSLYYTKYKNKPYKSVRI